MSIGKCKLMLGHKSICKLKAILALYVCMTLPICAIEQSQSINFESIQKKAIEHSYDLKIADYEVLISKTGITLAHSEYFPKLNFMAGTEYTKNFRDITDSTIMSVGDAFINPYTRYQSVLGITLSYNVFDFGVRRGKLDMAKSDVIIKELEEKEALQELKLNLIDSYTKVAVTKKQIDLYDEILALELKNLEMMKRLYNAHEISKTELNDEEVKVSEIKKTITELTQIYAETLTMLSFYTGEDYYPNSLEVAEMKMVSINPLEYPDYTQSLKWKLFEKEINKKEAELKVQKRNNYPKVTAYSRYYIYGSNNSSYPESLKGIEPSNFTIGGNVTMPVFDGFQNHANIERVSLELQQLCIKRDKAIAEWMTRLATLRSNHVYLTTLIEENEKALKELSDKEKSQTRLANKKIISPIELNNAKIELLKEKIEYEKNKTTLISITNGIELLTTY